MTTTKKEREEVLARLARLGFNAEESVDLRRYAGVLSRWAEMECNGEVERNDETGECWRVYRHPRGLWSNSYRIADRETSTKAKIDQILASHPSLAWYYQGDPRGASIYVYRADHPMLADYPINCIYSSISTADY